MDLNSTLDIIIRDLREAREIIDDMKNYPGVPILQIELAKSKCKSAGEIIELLKSAPERNVPLKEGKRETVNETVDKTAVIKETHEEKMMAEEVPVEKESADSNVVFEKSQEPSILADQFVNMHESINEQMGGRNPENDVTKILYGKPVIRLTEAIGLNDKFLFIRELFDGNSELYNQAISKLDVADNYADARNLLISYMGENNDTDAVRQLIDLLKRKFPLHE